jgi:hypothetical protein
MKTFIIDLYWKFYTWSTSSTLKSLLVGASIVCLYTLISLIPWLASIGHDGRENWWIATIILGAIGVFSPLIWAIYNSIKS